MLSVSVGGATYYPLTDIQGTVWGYVDSQNNVVARSSLRLTSIESVMPSSHLILCCPLLLLPPIPPVSARGFHTQLDEGPETP